MTRRNRQLLVMSLDPNLALLAFLPVRARKLALWRQLS